MNENIDEIIARVKNKKYFKNDESPKPKQNKYFKNLITRVLVSLILVLGSIIFIKSSSENMSLYKKHLLNDSLSFNKVNELYDKVFKEVLPFNDIVKENTQAVFNEEFSYIEKEKFHDGLKLKVANNYMIPSINSGIVVFIGEKENYGSTIIIQGMDGVDIWYSNINNHNLKLYDYIEKGSPIAESKEDTLYLVLQKDGEYLNYEEYNN